MLRSAISFLTLFTSASTLVCCALPALFVSLGFGATFVGLLGVFPQLVWLSEHKIALFVFAGLMLVVSYLLQRRARLLDCPAESAGAGECKMVRSSAALIWRVSSFAYLIGFFFAFLASRLSDL